MSAPETLIAGRYRLVKLIGSGGMGVVWEAWDERLQRPVAVKQLHLRPGLSPAEAETASRRAMREARITARLHHRHAVPVFDVVEQDGQPCLVMQYLPSLPLSAVLRELHLLSPAEAADLGAQIAAALATAHDAGIVHRDVKPGNVLVADDGTARISDFGIAHALGDATLTTSGVVTGTPAYLAPEVARGGESTYASDVFSLGATLYAALEGAPPSGTEQNPMALLHRAASGTFPPPRRSGPLTPLLLGMLEGDPADRPAMREVARELNELAARLKVLPPGDQETTVVASPAGASGPAAAGGQPGISTTAGLPPTMPSRLAAAAAPVPTASPTPAQLVAPSLRTAPATSAATRTPAALPAAPRTDPAPTATADTAVVARSPVAPAGTGFAGDPPTPARGPAAPSQEPPGRRRRGGLWAALLVVALLAGVTALVLHQWLGGPQTAADPARSSSGPSAGRSGATKPSTAPSSSRATPPTSSRSSPSAASSGSSSAATSSAPTTSASSGASSSASSDRAGGSSPVSSGASSHSPPSASGSAAPPTDGQGTPSAAELAGAITSYYALMPRDTDAAWSRMTPAYQINHAGGRRAYQRFWDAVSRVSVSDVSGSPPDRAEGTVTYVYSGGGVVTERTAYGLVRQDGMLKISSSSVLSHSTA